jgi:hypothetical protein
MAARHPSVMVAGAIVLGLVGRVNAALGARVLASGWRVAHAGTPPILFTRGPSHYRIHSSTSTGQWSEI